MLYCLNQYMRRTHWHSLSTICSLLSDVWFTLWTHYFLQETEYLLNWKWMKMLSKSDNKSDTYSHKPSLRTFFPLSFLITPFFHSFQLFILSCHNLIESSCLHSHPNDTSVVPNSSSYPVSFSSFLPILLSLPQRPFNIWKKAMFS